MAAYQAQQGATTYTTTTTTQPVGYAANNYSGVVGGNYTTSGAQYVTGTQYATVPQTVYTREAQVVGGTSGTQVVSGGQIVGGTTYIEGAPVTYENTQYTFTQPPVGYEYTTEYRKWSKLNLYSNPFMYNFLFIFKWIVEYRILLKFNQITLIYSP